MLGAFALTEAAFGEAAEGPVSPQGQQATASVGAVTVTGVANVSPSGLGASAELGDISIISVNSVFVSGLEVTATVGDAVGSIPVVISVTGLRAKAATITNEDQAPLFGGQTFAQGSFSSLRDTAEDLSFELGVTESVTGLEATASVGEVSVIGEANVAVSGLEATSSVEGVTVIGDANVSVTGLEATGTPGSVTIIEGQGVDAFVTSPRMVGRPGIVTAIPQVNVFVTGVSATGEVGQLNQTIWNPIDPSQTTTWTEIAA
jgi:hypothetical protein